MPSAGNPVGGGVSRIALPAWPPTPVPPQDNPVSGQVSKTALPTTAGSLEFGHAAQHDLNAAPGQFVQDITRRRHYEDPRDAGNTQLPNAFRPLEQAQPDQPVLRGRDDTTLLHGTTHPSDSTHPREEWRLPMGTTSRTPQVGPNSADYVAHPSPLAPIGGGIRWQSIARWGPGDMTGQVWHADFWTALRPRIRLFPASAYQRVPTGAFVPQSFAAPNPLSRMQETSPGQFEIAPSQFTGPSGPASAAFLNLPGEIRRS